MRLPPPADAAAPFTAREVTDMKARLVALITAPVAPVSYTHLTLPTILLV